MAAAPPVPKLPTTSFPLGQPGAAKQKPKAVSPGIILYTVVHGTSTDGYTVSLVIHGKDSGSQNDAQTAADAAKAAGYPAEVQKYTRFFFYD